MRLYNSFGPNPRAVRMCLAETGINLPIVEVDLMGMENRGGPCREKHSVGRLPDPGLADVTTWFARVATRPSAERSLHPQAEAVGMNG